MSTRGIVLLAAVLCVAFSGCRQAPDEASSTLAPSPASSEATFGPVLLHDYNGQTDDHSGNGNDGIIHGDPYFITSCLDRALDFDGQDDWIEVPYDPALEPHEVSLEVYFQPKHALTNNDRFVPLVVKMPWGGNFWNTADGYDMWYQNSGAGGRIGFGVAYQYGTLRANASWTGTITPNRYYHVVGTYDGSAIRLYLDGELVAEVPHAGEIAYLGGGVNIGGHISHSYYGPGYNWFQGAIDEVAIYPYAMSADEVARRASLCPRVGVPPHDGDNDGQDPDRRSEPGR